MHRGIYFIVCLSLRAGLFSQNGAGNIENLKRDPGLYLNFQDVPIFYDGNPLEGLNAFAVILPCFIHSEEVSKKISTTIEKELASVGTVIKAQPQDMNGFGTGNILNLQIGIVSKWDGGELPISRVTLNVETSVIIANTNIKSFPRVWSINDFIDSPPDPKSEDEIVGAIQKLLKEFIKNYQFANQNQTQKPVFYLY